VGFKASACGICSYSCDLKVTNFTFLPCSGTLSSRNLWSALSGSDSAVFRCMVRQTTWECARVKWGWRLVSDQFGQGPSLNLWTSYNIM